MALAAQPKTLPLICASAMPLTTSDTRIQPLLVKTAKLWRVDRHHRDARRQASHEVFAQPALEHVGCHKASSHLLQLGPSALGHLPKPSVLHVIVFPEFTEVKLIEYAEPLEIGKSKFEIELFFVSDLQDQRLVLIVQVSDPSLAVL